MADNNDNELKTETNLGEANIEGKNTTYFVNLPSNYKKTSQQNENAAASANYKAPKNFGKSAVLNTEQRKALRSKLAKGSKKVTPSKYSPKFKESGNNTPTNKKRHLLNAEKFNFTRKKKNTIKNNNSKLNSPEVEAERELQKKITPIAEKVQLLEKLKEIKYKLQDGIKEKEKAETLKEFTTTINNINKKLKEYGYIDVKVKDVTNFKQYLPFIFDTELEGLKSELLVKQKELKEAHKNSIAVNRRSNTWKKFLVNKQKAQKLRIKSLAAYHAPNKKNSNRSAKARIIEEEKKTGVKVNPFEYNPLIEKKETKPNENSLEEEPSANRIAAAKEKAKKLIEKGIENITLADKKAKAEGKPIVSEPAYVPKLVELNEDDAPEALPEPLSEALPEPLSEPAPEPLSEALPEPPSEPAAAEATPLTDLPPGWEEHRNNQGQVYYNNGTTTQWERPNGSSVSNTKPRDEFEAQLAEEKAAKAVAEAQLAEEKAAKEAAKAEVAEKNTAKEAAEAELSKMKAAKEAIEAQLAEMKAAKEAAEAKVVELKATNEANKPQETSEPTSPTNSNSKNTFSNNPQPSDEEKILQILEHGEDGFPPLELPDTLKTNFEHAIKPFYDKIKSEPNQAYVELYVKLYVLFYEVKNEEIPDGDLFEEGTKTDLKEFLTPDIKQKIKEKVKNGPYYDLMFRLGISKLYHQSLTDPLHILDNLNQIDLNI
jgi:hypothetical protein